MLKKKTICCILPFCRPDLAPRQKRDTYQLGRPICNPWAQCCCNKILLFWWNPLCVIKVNPKPNPLFFRVIFHFIFLHFPFLLLSLCACLWKMEGASNFLFGIWPWNPQELQESCVYAHSWWFDFQGLIWKKKTRMIPRMNEWKHMRGLKPWSLFFGLSGFTHEIIGP